MSEVEKQSKKKDGTSGLGIAGFVLSIFAILFSFIPIINNIAPFIGILAVIFGIIGTITHKKKGLSIAGLVLGILSIAITLALQSMWSKAIDESIESSSVEINNMTGENTENLLESSVSVELGEFSISKNEYGLIESSLPLTITNKEDEAKTFYVHLEAVDESGSRITDDYIYANDLGAGQSQEFEAFKLISDDKYDAMQNVTFNIIEVSMY